ncbi:MAG TPA: hypothetical protein VI011_20995 [Asanoa sp.]
MSPSATPAAVRWTVAVALAGTALLAAVGIVAPAGSAGDSPGVVQAPRGGGYPWQDARPLRTHRDRLDVGVTHTQYSLDPWGSAKALGVARTVLTATATYQNQHIFGWGTLNPEPSPGVYDWSSLDRRMALIRSTGGIPVLTLCCAPDWMKGGRAGETDWNRLHEAPRPEHYPDFAALAVAVARRYPDVRHFVVWNELKGFWDDTRNRWDYESYTIFYNTVYDALKAYDRTLAVGGPYVVVDTWADREAGGRPSTLSGECGTVDRRSLDALEYWLLHKNGADFVAIDGGAVTRDGGPVASGVVQSAIFGAITRWLRERTRLPIWWSEFHIGRGGPEDQPMLSAAVVGALLYMVEEKASVALYWQPQHPADTAAERPPTLWGPTELAGGGQPTVLAEALARMQQLLADPADDLVSWPLEQVGVLHGRTALLVVNTGGAAATVRIQGLRLRLEPFELRYVELPAGAPQEPPGWWRPAVDLCLREQPPPAG